MADTGENRRQRFFVALLIGAFLGAIVGVTIKYTYFPEEGPNPANQESGGETVPAEIQDSVAWRYAKAYQEGNWPQVLALTLWMEERIDFVARSETADALAAEEDRLTELVSTRSLTENYLQDIGVDDQYVFTPGARLAFIAEDTGRSDLEAPVEKRTWFRVVYPAREKALLDRDGMPIRSIQVGVNVTVDGRVLKAGIVGNLDVEWDSIRYDWPSD